MKFAKTWKLYIYLNSVLYFREKDVQDQQTSSSTFRPQAFHCIKYMNQTNVQKPASQFLQPHDNGLGSALENQDTNVISVSQPVKISCFDDKKSSKRVKEISEGCADIDTS